MPLSASLSRTGLTDLLQNLGRGDFVVRLKQNYSAMGHFHTGGEEAVFTTLHHLLLALFLYSVSYVLHWLLMTFSNKHV